MKKTSTPLFFLLSILLFSNTFYAQTNCGSSNAQTDLFANKVKTRLLITGDLWWDGSDGKYQADFVAPSITPSALYAGGVWMGGIAPSGELKMAASTYGRNRGITDYYAGPLDQITGTTNENTCQNWDRFFNVKKEHINEHLDLWSQGNYTVDQIPFPVKNWPARGNPHFQSTYGFELPNTPEGLADFWDENTDGIYNPLDGDYPALFQRGCDQAIVPDEMIFWTFNDAGGAHTESNSTPMQMEFQVTAFAFAQENAFDLSTFYKYRIINRGTEALNDAYFGIWADPDLGCYTDDFVGSDSTRSMWYLYNEDATDGEVGCTCPQGLPSYCDNVPMLGMDIFRGPLDSDGNELGMSSFTYHHNPSLWGGPPQMTDPSTATEYYNYLSGKWSDGSPYTAGGSGFQSGNQTTNYVFPSSPDCIDSTCWSMCSSNLPAGDHRVVQSTGPMNLQPGQSNELILGVVWVPSIETYPCPSLDKLTTADDFIQNAFDNCFDDFSDIEEHSNPPQKAIIIAPNPFSQTNNEQVTISNLPLQSTIRVFDLNGQLIANLENDSSESLSWNPLTSLPSGVFFIEIKQSKLGTTVLKWINAK